MSFTRRIEALRTEYIPSRPKFAGSIIYFVGIDTSREGIILLRLGPRSTTLQRFIPLMLGEMQNGDVAEEGPVTLPKVCYIYDTRMMQHESIPNFHPEQPLRISSIFAKLEEAGCIRRMVHVLCREALREEVTLVHTQELWNMVENFQGVPSFSRSRCP